MRVVAGPGFVAPGIADDRRGSDSDERRGSDTATPIQHVVVIFQENVSFEPSGVLLTNNPNANNPANGANAINPFRLARLQASTCDQDHSYGDEQAAFDQGLMDMFPASTGAGETAFCASAFAYGTTFGPSTPGLLTALRYSDRRLRTNSRERCTRDFTPGRLMPSASAMSGSGTPSTSWRTSAAR